MIGSWLEVSQRGYGREGGKQPSGIISHKTNHIFISNNLSSVCARHTCESANIVPVLFFGPMAEEEKC